MGRYLIRWDAGFGENYEVIDANDMADAEDAAFTAWKEDLQEGYSALELTVEVCDWYGLDPEDYGLEEESD